MRHLAGCCEDGIAGRTARDPPEARCGEPERYLFISASICGSPISSMYFLYSAAYSS